MSELKHGDRFTGAVCMFRRVKLERIAADRMKKIRSWQPCKSADPVAGVFLGYRSTQPGYVIYDGIDGNYFIPIGDRIRVALVSTGPNTNPIYVDPASIIKVPTTHPQEPINELHREIRSTI